MAAALLAAPAHANDTADMFSDEQRAVVAGVDAFFDALRSDDKTALANTMVPEGLIFIHNRMDPDNPRVDTVPVADHLARWATQPRSVDEYMSIDEVLVDGDMAQVWGPYYFTVEGQMSHCGINSMSMVRTGDGSWKVGNVSFTMVPPTQCAAVGADWVATDDN